MRFVAPCGHEGTPVTPNYITCEVCDRFPVKVETKPPTLTWKTLRQFHEELMTAYAVVVGSKGVAPGGVFAALAEREAEQLFELQEFIRNTFQVVFA